MKKAAGDEARAREFVGELFAHVPVLDTGGRGATTTFAQRGIGDALFTFESETALLMNEQEEDKLKSSCRRPACWLRTPWRGWTSP